MKVKQFKRFDHFEQEEEYLNYMAKEGFQFVKRSAFGIYHFKKATTNSSCYKVDYRIINKKADFLDYVSIFEDSGWKHIYGHQGSGKQYFLQVSEDATSDIFSDDKSKAERYIRLQRNYIAWLTWMVLVIFIALASVKFNISDLFFLTPGLWERQGAEFWDAFWFEFPFMLMRVLPVVFFAIGAILNGYWAKKAKKAYDNFLASKEI